jgi:integrase/recombinase XerD
MLEELERRNYAQTTIDCYIHTVEHFAQYFRRSPDQLGPDHIREYQVALFKKFKLAPNTISQRLAALRFFYVQTLKKAWSVAETPYPKKVLNLPMILSQEEVARLIRSALTPFHRIILMTLYATGLRRAELARLKIRDIDSQRMVIHIQGGKGRKDRDVMLSPKLLEALREYWRDLKRKPTQWLFPGGRSHTADRPITPKAVLSRLPACGPTGRPAREKDPSPHIASLLRHPLAGERHRPAHHSTTAGASRSGRDHYLPASFPTPSQRYGKPVGRTGPVARKREPPDTAKALSEPASLGDGRCHPHRWTALHRAQPQLDHLASPEGAAGHRTLPHRRARWTPRSVLPLRIFRPLVQLVSQPPLSKMPGQCPSPLAGGPPPRVTAHALRACRLHPATRTGAAGPAE